MKPWYWSGGRHMSYHISHLGICTKTRDFCKKKSRDFRKNGFPSVQPLVVNPLKVVLRINKPMLIWIIVWQVAQGSHELNRILARLLQHESDSSYPHSVFLVPHTVPARCYEYSGMNIWISARDCLLVSSKWNLAFPVNECQLLGALHFCIIRLENPPAKRNQFEWLHNQ